MITCLIFLIFCSTAINIGSAQQITPEVTILVSFPPSQFQKSYPNGTVVVNVKRGSNLVMECQVMDKSQAGKARTYWKLYPYLYEKNKDSQVINNGMTSQDHSRFKIGQGKEPDSIRMEILTVDESFGGIYACEVQYSITVLNARADVTVMVYDSPSISYTEYKTKVESSKDVTFSCKASGLPTPNVFWKRIGGDSNIIKNTGVVTYGNDLTLTKVTHQDAGTYSCVAENIWGSIERKFALSIIHSPVVKITPNGQEATQKKGCMIQLTCVVKADPNPDIGQIVWSSRNRGTLKTGGSVTTKLLSSSNQESFYIVRIFPTTDADLTDTYSCMATNSRGSHSANVVMKESTESNSMMSGPHPCSSVRQTYSTILFIICFSIYKYISL